MTVRIYFAKNDTSQVDYNHDNKNGLTFCFFSKQEVEEMKTFDLYLYSNEDEVSKIIRLGSINLFFKGNTDYDYLSPGIYQDYSSFNVDKRVYSIGTKSTYYKYLKMILKEYDLFLNSFGDIIISKENFENCKGNFKVEEFLREKGYFIAQFLYRLSDLIFKYDSEANYLTLSESKILYENHQFAEEYKVLYDLFFDRIKSNSLANDFLDFIQKCIYEGNERYKDFDTILKKIKEKYTRSSITKKILKLEEPVNEAYEKIENIKNHLRVRSNFLQENQIYLGHYTSLSTLRTLLEKQINNMNYQGIGADDSIDNEGLSNQNRVDYLRLTNTRLMNDPLEGKVITNFLDSSYKQKDFLASQIYMMSLTPNVDILPMWQQYGDNGEGVFIRLKNIFLEKIISESQAEIYRVCYLGTDGEVHVSNMAEEDERKLKGMLADLKRICEDLKENRNEDYLYIISNIQQDISFLFKTVDYSYEEEYRIVLSDPDNLKFEIECKEKEGYPFPFLYTYLSDVDNDSSKYSEVIIGPKAIDIDFIGPYISYLDPEIDISLSKIPYR